MNDSAGKTQERTLFHKIPNSGCAFRKQFQKPWSASPQTGTAFSRFPAAPIALSRLFCEWSVIVSCSPAFRNHSEIRVHLTGQTSVQIENHGELRLYLHVPSLS